MPRDDDGSAHPAALTLRDWQARGEDAVDPLRFRFLQALAARAADADGEVRRLLDRRLDEAMAAYRQQVDRPRAAAPSPGGGTPRPGPLADLLAHLARHAGPAAAPGTPITAGGGAAPELKTVRAFRATWTRLRTERRLSETLARVPDQAGPLNSQHLVHRALRLMHDASPGTLEHFLAYADSLMAMEQLLPAATGPALRDTAPRPAPPRRGATPSGKGGGRRRGP